MATDLDDIFQIDTRDFERYLTKIEKQVLPQAQAGFLSGIAFGARRALLADAEKNIQGGPTAFTKKGFVVQKASTADLEAWVGIRDEQQKYMSYLINGGVRSADNGSSRSQVRVDGDDEYKNKHGNYDLRVLKYISRNSRSEKNKRARLRAKRDKLRAAGKSTAPALWKNNSTSGNFSGVFFGTVNDKKGYWRRQPRRYWYDTTGSLKMLVRFADHADYKPTFRWDDVVEGSVKSSDLQKMYSAEITRALRKLNGS